MEEISIQDLLRLKESADNSFDQGNLSDAFHSYVTCMEMCEDLKPVLKYKFEVVLCEYFKLELYLIIFISLLEYFLYFSNGFRYVWRIPRRDW